MSSGLAVPDTVTVTVGTAPVAITRSWLGGDPSAPSDWSNPANWVPAGVPGPADSVIIGSSDDAPVLTADVTVARLEIGSGWLTFNGQALTVTGDFSTENGAGYFVMDQPADSLVVRGNARFQGGAALFLSDGVLAVAGDFEQRNAGANTSTFQAQDGNHRTVLNGPGAQRLVAEGNVRFGHLEIASGGDVTDELESAIDVQGAFHLRTPVAFIGGAGGLEVEDSLTTVPGSRLAFASVRVGGGLAVEGGFEVGLIEFSGEDQDVPALPYQNVLVSELARLVAPVTISGSLQITGGSSGSSLTVNGHTLTVGNLVIGGGGADPAALVMRDPTDVVVVTGFALFDGDSASTNLTDGMLSLAGDLLDGGTGGTGFALRASDDHRIVFNGAGAQQIISERGRLAFAHLEIAHTGPGVTIAATDEVVDIEVRGELRVSTPTILEGEVARLDVADSVVTDAGSTVLLNELVMRGGLDIRGALAVDNATFAGTGQEIPGQVVLRNVQVQGTARLSDAMAWPGFVLVRGAGADLDLGGHRLDVGTFAVGGVGEPTGTLTMTDPADSLVVTADASFAGGATTGRLTAGTLVVGGGFFQAENPEAFQPSGSHRTVLTGSGVVRFAHPGATGQASWFHDLVIAGPAAPLFQLNAAVTGGLELIGSMTVQPAVMVDVVGHLLLRAGATLTNSGTVQYGTFTNEGATINGNAPVQRP
jgi:hypothetical protein